MKCWCHRQQCNTLGPHGEGRTEWIQTLISTSEINDLVIKIFEGNIHGIMKKLSGPLPITVSLKEGIEVLPVKSFHLRDTIPLDSPARAHRP